MRYMVVIEKCQNGCGVYVSGLPGCITAGETREEILR